MNDWEKEITGPPPDYRTKPPKKLNTINPITVTAKYDPPNLNGHAVIIGTDEGRVCEAVDAETEKPCPRPAEVLIDRFAGKTCERYLCKGHFDGLLEMIGGDVTPDDDPPELERLRQT